MIGPTDLLHPSPTPHLYKSKLTGHQDGAFRVVSIAVWREIRHQLLSDLNIVTPTVIHALFTLTSRVEAQ
jgi:hypothetical protein